MCVYNAQCCGLGSESDPYFYFLNMVGNFKKHIDKFKEEPTYFFSIFKVTIYRNYIFIILSPILVLLWPELGTRQFCRNNVTMFSGHKVVCICNFTIFVVATPARHWGLTIFRNFSGPWLILEALLRCHVVVVAKLKNCRVPSSGFDIFWIWNRNFWSRIYAVLYAHNCSHKEKVMSVGVGESKPSFLGWSHICTILAGA